MRTLSFDNGDNMPQLGLGTWKSDPGEVGNAVREAIGAGYRHIDCAHNYGNEAEVGQALAAAMGEGIKRKELWITSKLWNDAHHPENVRPALESTLAHLKLDYLDLYLMHWPVAQRPGTVMPESAEDLIDPDELPFTETWEAMEACVEAGLVRHIGVSNFSAQKLQRLIDESRIRPEMNQVELHPYLQQDELLSFCTGNDIRITAYSPLGSSDRPQSMKAADEPVLLEDPTIKELAERHDASPAQILIAWALERGTAVVAKSVNAGRIRENLAATKVTMEPADMQAIAKLDRERRYLTGDLWTIPGSGYTLENLWDE